MRKSKGLTALIIILLAACVCMAAVFASGQIAKSNSISPDTAAKIAFADANVNANAVADLQSDFQKDSGLYCYKIEFTAPEGLFAYTINAKNGQIMSRSVPAPSEETADMPAASSSAARTAITETPFPAAETSEISESETPCPPAAVPTTAAASAPEPKEIGIESAREIALKDANAAPSSAVFSKAKQERDDGVDVYKLEFYVAGIAEYEYKIEAATGRILEKEIEPWNEEDSEYTPEPVLDPTAEPTEEPTPEPSPSAPVPEVPDEPEPTEAPTPMPTETPAPEPTEELTPAPTEEPAPATTGIPDDDIDDDDDDDLDDDDDPDDDDDHDGD